MLAIPVLCATLCALSGPTVGAEITAPGQQTAELIKPELAAKFVYTEDGELSDALKLPIYQWMPVGGKPDAIILGIHGLTLHGRRYRVLARTMAVHNLGFVALDMRGFGRCKFDDKKQFSTPTDDKRKISHEKSYAEIVKLAQLIKAQYGNVPLIVLGESLGCTFCVRLCGEHPELADGMIISAPAVRVNPKMYASPADIKAGLKAVVTPKHKVNLNAFITKLVSQRPEVVKEMLDDPLVLKEVSLLDLISTDEFVEKTAKWGKTVRPHLPIMILQGSHDGCVAPKSVTDLMMNMPSDDQTLRWMGSFGHLQLETSFVHSVVIDALGDWMKNHTADAKNELKELEQDINDLGGTLVN